MVKKLSQWIMITRHNQTTVFCDASKKKRTRAVLVTHAVLVIMLMSVVLFLFVSSAQAAAPTQIAASASDNVSAHESYYRGQVLSVKDNRIVDEFGDVLRQELIARITSGPEKNLELSLVYEIPGSSYADRALKVGDRVVIVKSEAQEGVEYYITEVNRLWAIYVLIGLFALLAVALAGRRGALAFIGLAVTVAIIAYYLVPNISSGKSPVLVSLMGAILIASSSLFIAHGRNFRTLCAFVGIIITTALALGLSHFAVSLAHLTGFGTEEAFYLQFASLGSINIRGLLLGGMIIGALGVLDDVTTAQAAAVYELKLANPKFGVAELYKRGSAIGREHIISLVNTLVLAYTGASFPLLLLFSVSTVPFWVTLNTEFVAEEVVRTLVGSIALILAVPITTALAAAWFSRESRLAKG